MKETDLRKALELIDQRANIQAQLATAKQLLALAFKDDGTLGVQLVGYSSSRSHNVQLVVEESRDIQAVEDLVLTLFDRRLDVCDRALEELGVEV